MNRYFTETTFFNGDIKFISNASFLSQYDELAVKMVFRKFKVNWVRVELFKVMPSGDSKLVMD